MPNFMKFELPQDDNRGGSLPGTTGALRETPKIENKKMYLSEGKEKWFQTVKEYWVNYEANARIESTAKNTPEKQIDQLIISFYQGVSDTHHRLASNIGAIRSILSEKGFFTDEQLGVLQEIIENSKEAGKIKRYRKDTDQSGTHPVYKIYETNLNGGEVSSEELEILKRDAYGAGQSTAASESIDEVMSWFSWAGGEKYVEEGNKIPVIMLRLRNGDIAINNIEASEEEKKLLVEGLLHSNALESGAELTAQEMGENRTHSDKAIQEWAKLYFSDKFQLSPSFLDYIR